MSMPNEALQKLLQEIEQKASFAQQQMVIVKSQIDSSKREIRMIDLTNKEISTLPKDAKLYEGVGKMFVASPTPDVNARLDKEKKELTAKLENLDKKYTFLETTFKNSQEHLDKVFKNGGR
ncbi:putative prefoldin subunit 1 [Elsinoe australis]|uniref:Putative prefoldin subunit 1 n=1 Tax=Elsinoe australis TaxID=40998 RepID=A0A4U7AYL1_9PEZI|nr:putative prefoldin subunit 1 [Elsinoe australis]